MFDGKPYRSVNKAIENSLKENWERPALSNYKGDTYSYGELATKIKKIHIGFEKCGIKQGDKVALCSRNQANWAVCYLATITYGAVIVPILHEFKAENINYLVSHSESRVLFVDEATWEGLAETEIPKLEAVVTLNQFNCIYVRDKAVLAARDRLDDILAEEYPNGYGPDDIHYYEDSPEELALISYTSGTSGFSKGVMLPYRALSANIRFAGEDAEPQMNCECELVAMLPTAHMYGMLFEFLFQITIGTHIHFLTRVPSPKIILQAFSEIHPDLIIAVPLIIEKVYKSQIKPIIDSNSVFLSIPILNQFILKKIRNGMIEAFGGRFEEIIIGGAAFNPEVEEFLRKIHFPFTVGYGMTECGPIISYEKWWKTRQGSCGRKVKFCDIRIDSPDPVNTPGEVQIKGDNVFLGYYKNEKATAESFTEDGWFKTGDMGVIDADGYLYLRGRSKCMILGPSGQNIYPEELEAVINNVTYVVESLVIEDNGGLTALIYPDYHQGEIDGLIRAELEGRISSCLPEINKLLPSYAQIRKIEFLPEDFERTPKRSIKRYLYQRN